ncbi:MAG: YraN family protein [Cyanobacteria bacterium J06659_2]
MAQGSRKQLGDRGEALVAAWLQQQGWSLVAQQWHCRWGELDIVARSQAGELAFVEVKTRRRYSIDQGGRLAITPQKQQKLWRAAQQFLLKHPEHSDAPCRFDVALVTQGTVPNALITQAIAAQPPLALVEYIANAFQLE